MLLANTNTRNFLTLGTAVLERNWPGAVGSPIQVSREGKASPLEAGRGKEFPACEPEKGHCGGCGAIGRWFTRTQNCQCTYCVCVISQNRQGGRRGAQGVRL